MIEAIKDNWWAEKAPPPKPRLGWRPIDPYCVQDIPYYALTSHFGGYRGDKPNDRYLVSTISGYTPPEGILLKRTDVNDVDKETGIPNNTKIPASFSYGDKVWSTIPLNKLRELKARFHMVKGLLFVPSIHAPNLQMLDLRGNRTELGHLDMTNCRKLHTLVTSECYIDSIALPSTGPDDTDNYFNWAYLGDFNVSDRRQMPPISVIDAVTKRAYYSRVSTSTTPRTAVKQLFTDTGNGHLFVDGINMHKALTNEKNWLVYHLSVESFNKSFSSSAAGSLTLDFMTTHHNYNVVIENAPWLTCSNPTGNYSMNVQTLNFNATANTTGQPRSTTIKLRKIKEYPRTVSRSNEHNTEYHHAAWITITQPG